MSKLLDGLNEIAQDLEKSVIRNEQIEQLLSYSDAQAIESRPNYNKESLSVRYNIHSQPLEPPAGGRQIEWMLQDLLHTAPATQISLAGTIADRFAETVTLFSMSSPSNSDQPIHAHLFDDIMDCRLALPYVFPHPQPAIEEHFAKSRHAAVKRLLIAYAEVVESEYMFIGNDIFANRLVQFGARVESSYARLLVDLCASALGAIFELVLAEPFQQFEPRSYLEEYPLLAKMTGEEMAGAAEAALPELVGNHSEVIRKIESRFLCEYEILCNRRRKYSAMSAPKGKAKQTPKSPIPSEHRSKAITKQLAAELLGRGNPDSGVKWLNECIEHGIITCEKMTRQSYIFDMRQFPAESLSRLTPAKSR